MQFSAIFELWRRAIWLWRNLKKIHQILFYHRVLGSRRSRDCIARVREHRESDQRAFLSGYKVNFCFFGATLFKRLFKILVHNYCAAKKSVAPKSKNSLYNPTKKARWSLFLCSRARAIQSLLRRDPNTLW